VITEPERFLALARTFQAKAESMRATGRPDEAGRAAFHAAQAAIYAHAGKVVTAHQGVHAEFASVVKTIPDAGSQDWSFPPPRLQSQIRR